MKLLISSIFLTASLLPVAAFAVPVSSDTVTIHDGFYGSSSITVPEDGSEAGPPVLAGRSAIFGQAFDVFFTEPGTNIISDHLFSLGGQFPGPGDNIYFSSDGMTDPFLGTVCESGMSCIAETGGVQDVTGLVQSSLPDPTFFCGGGGNCQFLVQSDADGVPEPSTYLLFATGLAGLLGYGWRRRPHAA